MSYPLLPPWGRMNEDFESAVNKHPMPYDWKPLDGSTDVSTAFSAWVEHVVGQIADTLWPAYQPGRDTWNTESIAQLLDTDFRLLAQLHPYLGHPINGAFPTTVTHRDFYAQEDDVKVLFGSGYERYDPLLPLEVRLQLPDAINKGIVRKSGNLDLLLKQVFQRPRAYQVAFLLGRSDYHGLEAKAGNTPSMVSGHCLEAAMGGCNAFAQLRTRMAQQSLSILRQFTVDIGDRRVFAGVHYPSDNLSSWITALNLVPHVFDATIAAEVKSFLWQGIQSDSAVYALIREDLQSCPDSPYRKAVELLGALA
jgi:hypothetical protein